MTTCSTYLNRKHLGLCVKCGNPSRSGKVLCNPCAQHTSHVGVDLQRRNKALGLCACGNSRRVGHTDCARCAHIKSNAMKALKRHRKLTGLCKCGQQPKPGKTSCARCQQHVADAHKKCANKRKILGLCPTCGKQAKSGKLHCTQCLATAIANGNRVRQMVFDYYGTSCNCCGESETLFLSIDHIYGDGHKHRQKIAGPHKLCGGHQFYRWLIQHDFPSGFQTLCMNCNTGKYKNDGMCPHMKMHEKLYLNSKQKLAHCRRAIVFQHYGLACKCCGENMDQFLTIDHINNDGNTHRRTIGNKIYKWLIDNDLPTGFQTLCFNCNLGKHRNGGTCPHQARK